MTIISHRLSSRYGELCLFETLYPAPLAQPFSKGSLARDYLRWAFIPLQRIVPLRGTLSCAFGAALLQGPTRQGLSHMSFHAAYRIVSCSVVMLTRFPTICNYRQTRSPLEKGAAKGRDRRKRQLSNFCVAGEGNCWKIGILQMAVM